jgi:mono/diheme cytochrome c family protein
MRLVPPILALGIASLVPLLGWAAAPPVTKRSVPSAEAVAFFETHVRPMLVEHCVSCHGAKAQRGGLRVDSRAALLKGGDSGPALTPGEPAKSLMVKAVHRDGELKMPPKAKDALSPSAVANLETWIRAGATWPIEAASKPAASSIAEARKTHWSFRPVSRPTPPVNRNAGWGKTPVDHFILAKLEAKCLTPAPETNRRTLIRRVTFDLLGLPPTPEEVEAFVKDPASDAYERLVDRLLANPAYGERWGRHWLDVARYSDTKGYVFNEERRYPYSYTYRDYVIRAFNEDRPYDQFILEQLAADKLDLGSDSRPLAAMGYLTLGRRFLNNVPDIIDDRIDVTMRGLQGLTVGCARCHDHKFDPIPSRDYYSLYGVFASSMEPKNLPLIARPAESAALAAFEKELKVREDAANAFIAAKVPEVRKLYRAHTAEYLLAATLKDPSRVVDLNRPMFMRWTAFLVEARKKHNPVLAPWFALSALSEKEFAAKAPTLMAEFAANLSAERPIHPLVANLFFTTNPPTSVKELADRYAALLAESDKGKPDHAVIRTTLGGPSELPAAEIEKYFNRAHRDALVKLRKKVDEWKATGPGAPPRAMVLNDGPIFNPYVFLRGNQNNHGVSVPRQFVEVVAGETRQPFKQGSGRLELAKAIASKDNPLTARVLVNRVWMHHFGKGIVATPSDFGFRGEPPTHPELLDWLASNFMDNGWSVKKLQRTIVLSATYRQGIVDNAKARGVDPDNTLLWRMNRRRLEFEALRDSLLAVAGRLDAKMGGPGVEITASPSPPRRTVYGYIERQNLPGVFRTFDLASPDASTPQRFTTTVPQQALFLMNNPFVQEQAKALLARPDVTGQKTDAERVDRMVRLAYGRPAESEEIALALEFVKSVTGKSELSAWEQYAQVLLLGNEFAFVD